MNSTEAKPTKVDAARQEVIEAVLSYGRITRQAMTDPMAKTRWQAAHSRLLVCAEILAREMKAEEPAEC